MNSQKKIMLVICILALTLSMFAPLAAVTAQSSSLFNVTIIAPGNANLLRRQWTDIFASNLDELGINAKVVYLPWASVYDRCLTPAADLVGKTWDQGGWDVLALGWTPGVLPDPRPIYYGGDSSFFAPSGQNYYLWNNATANSLLDTWITSNNETQKASVLTQWQQIYYNEVPASQIMYQAAPAVVNPHITGLGTPVTGAGEGWLYFNAVPYPQLLGRNDGKTTIVYCCTSSIDALIPPLSDSWYDVCVSSPIFDGLTATWPTLNQAAGDLAVPDLLTSWSHSSDNFNWTLNCRQGVTWQDGQPFTANDVVYSLWALMNSATGSQFVGYYQSVFGDNVKFTYSNGTSVQLGTGDRIGTITATDQNTVQITLPVLVNGLPYGHMDPDVLGFANNIIPMHIFEYMDLSTWSGSVFNTGEGSTVVNGVTYTGPIGTGPYKFVSYDTNAQVIHLTRNDNYWNATGLKNAGLFTIKDYYIQFVSDGTAALADLKNGQVDMLDYNYNLQTQVGSVDPSWGTVLSLTGCGRQEFGYNMQSPIYGTGVDTPLGIQDPTRAADAARDIRQAFDYAIPRQQIIDNLLAGYGTAGATPMLPSQPYYDNSISARPYDLNQARQLLQAAGYSPPGASSANVLSLQGTANYSNGTAIATTTVYLEQTTDNSTIPASLQVVTPLTTSATGQWSFTVTQSTPGTYYYYLLDNSTGVNNYSYIQSQTITSATPTPTTSPTSTNYTWVYIAVAVVVIVIIIAAIALAMRKKPKPKPT